MNHPDIRIGLKKDLENANLFILHLKNIVKAGNQLLEVSQKFRQKLSDDIATSEKIEAMRQIFNETSSSMKNILEQQKEYILMIDVKILPSLETQKREIEDLQEKQKDLEGKQKEEEEKAQEIKKMPFNTSNINKEKALQNYENAKKETLEVQISLINKLKEYVKDRNSEIKAIIAHKINKQMQYHALALAELSKLASNINQQKQDEETSQFIEEILGRPDETGEGDNQDKEQDKSQQGSKNPQQQQLGDQNQQFNENDDEEEEEEQKKN